MASAKPACPGTGVFMPLVAQDGGREAGRRWSGAASADGSRQSMDSNASSTSSGSSSQHSRETVCRMPWRAAEPGSAASSPGASPAAAGGLVRPSAAISAAWTELDAAWTCLGSSPPLSLQGGGEACGAAAYEAPQLSSSSMAWVPVPSSAAAPSCELASAPAAAPGLALGPELGSSDARLATWPGMVLTGGGAIDSAPGCMQWADDAADASAIDAQLSALLQLREQLAAARHAAALATTASTLAPAPALAAQPAMLLTSGSTAPAECPVSSLAQRKLQQLAAMREMEAQLQAEVAALLPLL